MKNFRSYCAEFIGTFFLVLTVCVAGVLGYAGPYAPIAIGAVLMVMVYATGYISGGHLNPAVTLAVWIRGKLPGREVLPYIIAQMLAGILAALVAKVFASASNPITPAVFPFFPAVLAEFLYTFALCYVILNVATAEANAGNSFSRLSNWVHRHGRRIYRGPDFRRRLQSGGSGRVGDNRWPPPA